VAAPPGVAPPPHLRKRFFEFGDLDRYTARERALILAADRTFYTLIAGIGPTVRWEFRGGEHLERIYRGGHQAIFAFWHNRVFYKAWFWRRRRIVVMTSQSFDGEYIARFIQRFGYGAARGSSSRGGGRALVAMDSALKAGFDVAFTVDGPRGPVYEAKPGPALLARRSGQPIVPVHAACTAYWTVKSWDRFQIPKPFSRVVVSVAEPIFVPAGADDGAVAAARDELQAALEGLRARYDRQ
jgi:lysophospholipid acyltransferase (LPLAT)-like uncharacterized protein